MAFELNGRQINIHRPYTTPEGVTYPHLRDPAIRAQLGIVEVPDVSEPYDQRFYWGPNNPKLLNDREEVDEQGNPLYVKVLGEVDGKLAMVDTTERLVTKGLKSQWIAQVKQTAGSMLAQTDWMVIRKAERDVAIPDAVATKRAAIIAEADRLEAAITACASVEELIAVVNAQGWPNDRV
jgi:hypothetical protein